VVFFSLKAAKPAVEKETETQKTETLPEKEIETETQAK